VSARRIVIQGGEVVKGRPACVERLLWAGNSLDKAREIFDAEVKRRPRIRLTIRQRMRVLQRWPET
jgi:hypothetical protein